MISLIQHFEADFLWKVSLKVLNSGIILKTFTHVYRYKNHIQWKMYTPLQNLQIRSEENTLILLYFFEIGTVMEKVKFHKLAQVYGNGSQVHYAWRIFSDHSVLTYLTKTNHK